MRFGPLCHVESCALFGNPALAFRRLMFRDDVGSPGRQRCGTYRDRDDDIWIHAAQGKGNADGYGGNASEQRGIFSGSHVFARGSKKRQAENTRHHFDKSFVIHSGKTHYQPSRKPTSRKPPAEVYLDSTSGMPFCLHHSAAEWFPAFAAR